MAYVRTVDPDSLPVTLDELKAHLRIVWGSEDTYLSALLSAATRQVERMTRRQLMPATYALTLDKFPKWELLLPVPPVTAVTTIAYRDQYGAWQTFTDFTHDYVSEPARLTPKFGFIWPFTYFEIASVLITFTAGYTDAASVPATLKHAIKLLTGHWYENREPVAMVAGVTPVEIPYGIKMLLVAEGWGSYLTDYRE